MLAVQSIAHTVRTFPYRFRFISVMACGALGGAVSVFSQKMYAQRWMKAAAPPAVVAIEAAKPAPAPAPVQAPVPAAAPVETREILAKAVPDGELECDVVI